LWVVGFPDFGAAARAKVRRQEQRIKELEATTGPWEQS
jgi:hypothetical protein